MVAGTTNDHITLARYQSNGRSDNDFGRNSIVGGPEGAAPYLLLQPDQKIVTIGTTFGIATLFRVNSNGTIDDSFGRRGFNFGPVGMVTGVIAQSDGKIMTTGSSGEDFALVRYSADGSVEDSFGTNGVVTTDFGSSHLDLRLALQADGKLVTVGGSDNRFLMQRYNSDGSNDTSFGNAGVVTPTGNIKGLARQPDGKLLLAGFVQEPTYPGYLLPTIDSSVLWRYLPDGTLDASFSEDGTLDTSFAYEHFNAVAVQADGKIVAVGTSFRVARYLPDGTVDIGFGTKGTLTTNFAVYSNSEALALLVQPNGKILVGGYVANEGAEAFALARYNSDGALDADFGNNGTIVTAFPSGVARIVALAAQTNGSIVAVGNPGAKLARYFANGSLDSSFSDNGYLSTGLDETNAVAIQASGNIIVAGSQYGDFALRRYLLDGSSDTSFGANGLVSADFGSNDVATALVLQPDKKMAVAGYSADTGHAQFALARYLDPVEPQAPSPVPPGCAFADVCADNTFALYIQDLKARGLIEAYLDGTFHVWDDASRGTLARWLVKARGWSFDLTDAPHFADVPPEHPDYQYIETAYNHGVLSGYSASGCDSGRACFKPGNSVTRGQMSKMIVNAMAWPIDTEGQPHFVDTEMTNPFYSQIETIYRRGIVSGYDAANGGLEFRWQNNLTRGQLSKVLSNSIALR